MEDPIAKLRSGDVRGVLEKHEDGFDYYAFKGIPYTEPLVGDLRFKVSGSNFYTISYNSSDSISQRMIKNAPKGVSHFDELPYFFQMRAIKALRIEYAKKGTGQYKIMEQVTEMWTNFAKYGKPTVDTTDLIPVQWTPVRDGTVLCYLNIDGDITMQSTINFEQELLALKDIQV